MLGLLLEPDGAGQRLALGAMPIAARVVGDPALAAVQAVLDMAAQRRGAADAQVAHRLALRRREHAPIALQKLRTVLAQDVGHFQGRPGCHGGGHAWPSVAAGTRTLTVGVRARPSSRCGNCCKRRMLMCRYFAVVLKWLCPNNACTLSRSTPASSKCVAKLCRSVCG